MINKIFLLRSRRFILLLFLCVMANADALDVISAELQPGDHVCWAVCTDMLLQFYGNDPNLHGIWVSGTNGVDIGNGLCEYPHPEDLNNVHDILEYGNSVDVSSTCHSGSVLWSDLQSDIRGAKPIIAGLSNDDWGHAVLVVGYTNDKHIYINDPANGNQSSVLYDDFCVNSIFYWEESLVPDEGSTYGTVPVANPSISIATGPTQFVYPGSQTTYTSVFSCPTGQTCMPPGQWNWSLVFFHNNGNYTVASQNISQMNNSTWNVSAFTLPTSGFQWIYNNVG